MVANISLVAGIVMLFLKWHISIPLFGVAVILWFIARNAHKKRAITSLLVTGLNKSAKTLAKKYKSPEGIAELKKKGFSDESIRSLQKSAEEDAKRGIFRNES